MKKDTLKTGKTPYNALRKGRKKLREKGTKTQRTGNKYRWENTWNTQRKRKTLRKGHKESWKKRIRNTEKKKTKKTVR